MKAAYATRVHRTSERTRPSLEVAKAKVAVVVKAMSSTISVTSLTVRPGGDIFIISNSTTRVTGIVKVLVFKIY